MKKNSGRLLIGGYLRLFAAGLAVSGCSAPDDDVPRQPVAGTVLVDGLRLTYGLIIFYPQRAPTRADGAIPSEATIENGSFSLPRRFGLAPGKYKIWIQSERRRQERIEREASPETRIGVAKGKIPAKFNSESVLEVEVKEGGIKDLKIEIGST
jgi:hypothetical protein